MGGKKSESSSATSVKTSTAVQTRDIGFTGEQALEALRGFQTLALANVNAASIERQLAYRDPTGPIRPAEEVPVPEMTDDDLALRNAVLAAGALALVMWAI